MGEKKNWLKRSLVLILTLMLVCNGMSQTMLTVSAQEEAAVPEAAETDLEESVAEPVTDSVNTEAAEPAAEPAGPAVDDAGKAEEEKKQGDIFAGQAENYVRKEISVNNAELPDNEELLQGYIDQLFFGDMNGGISLFGDFGLDKLTSAESRAVYSRLKLWIQQVAAGTAPKIGSNISTVREETITLSVTDEEILQSQKDFDSFANGMVGRAHSQINTVIDYLMMDNPYDFYWYDKTKTGGASIRYGCGEPDTVNKVCEISVKFSFSVSSDFAPKNVTEGDPRYLVDGSIISGIQAAAAEAQKIVDKYADKTDYEKLDGYRSEICNLTAYNYDAADDNTNTPYGNPWQLIWVFDGDPATNVVCEGYSKAFQYLCDLSSFKNAVCYTVTGDIGGGHMWNIVTLEGKNYLVDITNCDDAIGSPDKLFLAGTSIGSVSGGYTFNFGAQSITYTYDADQKDLFGTGILTLADKNYEPKTLAPLTVTVDPIEVTYGDSVDSSALNGKGTAEADGTAVAGTFKWAEDVTTYGTAGTRQIKAVFTPDDGSLGYEPQTVSVTVTVNPKPITVTADDKEKTYGGADPELSYTVEAAGLVGGDTLSGKPAREAGEDVRNGGYSITQGTLTDAKNPNYQITFIPGTFTINPAEIQAVTVTAEQNILQGVGEFAEPVYIGLDGKEIAGTNTYGYDGQSGLTYAGMVNLLKELPKDKAGTISCAFQPDSQNYKSKTDAVIRFTVKDIEFTVGGGAATADNAVTVKTDAVYGDSWSELVKIKAITAKAGDDSDSNAGHFTLAVDGIADLGSIPDAGSYTFRVLYNGTLNGKAYTDSEVLSRTITVQKKKVTVKPGTYKVSKVYDGTVGAGTASGAPELIGRLSTDTEADLSVTVTSTAYSSVDAGSQTAMEVTFQLTGNKVQNYEPPISQIITVPCEILPKTITPDVTVAGGSVYDNGNALKPAVTVADSGTVLILDKDYTLIYSNNTNAGTGKVSVSPVPKGNYQWAAPVTKEFAIDKADYSGRMTDTKHTKYGNSDTYDLASLLPAGAKLGAAAVTDADTIFTEGPVLSGTVLSYQLDADTAKIGKEAVIKVPVTETANYKPFDITITVVLSDKLPQSDFKFDTAEVSKVYGAGDFTVAAKNAVSGSTVTYTSSDPAVAQIDAGGKVHILKAGSAVITATASETDDYAEAQVSYTLTVSKKPLVWDTSGLYARDKQGEVTDKAATLYGELRVSGILAADASKAVFTCTAEKLAGTYADDKPGQKKVTLTWAGAEIRLEGEGAGNYTMPSSLPEITGTINAVKEQDNVPESTDAVQYKLEVEGGISQIPDALKAIDSLNTPAKLEGRMESEAKKKLSSAGIAEVYDVVLMVNDGTGWEKADQDNFPEGGITVTLPYPEGTAKDTHNYAVAHMFTIAMNNHQPGDVEYPAVTKTDAGIQFKVTSLSPISVAAEEIRTAAAGGVGNGTNAGNGGAGANRSARTGDESNILLYVLLMALGAAGIGYAAKRKTVRQ